MNDERWGQWREVLPDWVAGRLSPDKARRVASAVDEHDELAAEALTLRRLYDARPEPPADLAERISAAVREEQRRDASSGTVALRPRRPFAFGFPRWALGAAAVAVVALGTMELMERSVAPVTPEPLEQVALEETPSPWVTEEAAGPGQPVLLDDLSDEALNTLLEELGG